MSKLASILIVGVLPPCTGAGVAATVQCALALANKFDVTVVISDTAPPTTSFDTNSAIRVIRLRTLKACAADYKNHRRLYVMGDSQEYLFALELYQQAPGLVLAPSRSLNQLILDLHASQPGWPENYANWLAQALGAEGTVIAQGLVHHRRFSNQLLKELPTISEIAALPDTGTFLLHHADLVENAYPLLPNGPHTRDRSQVRRSLGLDDGTTLVLWTDDGAAPKAVDTITTLQDEAPRNIHFKLVNQTEENLSALVAAADVILVTSGENECPPLAVAGLTQQKAIITSGQLWTTSWAPEACIKLPHAGALHQMVAAIGALATSPELRRWYSTNIAATGNAEAYKANTENLWRRLAKEQQPLLLPQSAPASPSPKKPTVDIVNPQPLRPGPARSVALIGAVPPRPLLGKMFPEVDWDISPRFATEDIASALCLDSQTPCVNKLALAGYDTPMIVCEDGGGKQLNSKSWQTVQTALSDTQEALSFGCKVSGAIKADVLIARQENNGYQWPLSFQKNESQRSLDHYEEDCGLFWHLDPVRHQVNCTLIAGLHGKYRINLGGADHTLMIIDGEQSSILSNNQPVILTADDMSLLSFTVSALCNHTLRPLSHDALTKTLAECDVNLEWLGHG